MNTARTRLIYWGALAIWAVFLSLFSVIKYAPESAHADIMMNSIMSLQNLSLFYWGQNRLLSVLPLVLVPFRDPEVNFWMCLFMTSLTFYSLLVVLSWTVLRSYRSPVLDADVLLVFLVGSSLFLALISDSGAVIFLLGHIEYSLSALLFLLAANVFLGTSRAPLVRYMFSATLLFIATGVNPSILLPASFSVAAFLAWRKRLLLDPLVFAGAALLAFLVWRGIADVNGGTSQYESFALETLLEGLPLVAINVLNLVNPISAALVISVLSVLYLALYREKWRAAPEARRKLIFVSVAVLIFSVGWLLFFSGTYWIRINRFAPRYFTFILYALLLLAIFHVAFYATLLDWRSKLIAGATAAFLSIPLLVSPLVPTSEFRIFREVYALTGPDAALYAGDYWLVWPSVLRDMMHGFESLGLAYRGEGNSVAVNAAVRAQIESHGYFDVFCLNSGEEDCVRTIEIIVGPVRLIDAEPVRDRVTILRLNLA